MSEPPVAIVVLTYDGFQPVREALLSVGSLTYPSYDVIVVDNGSSDTTSLRIRERFPRAELLAGEVKLGVAGGFNVGLRRVVKGEWKYALVMHNDVEPEPSMLSELVATAEARPSVAAVSPKIHLFWDRERLLSAGGLLAGGRFPVRWRGYDEIDRGQYEEDCEVDCGTGAAMLVNVETVREVGLLDPQLRHYEDVDWCVRARAAGYSSYYSHRAAAWRLAVRTAPDRPARAREAGRSAAFLMRRHGSFGRRLLFVLAQVGALAAALPQRLIRRRRSPLSRARGALEAMSAVLAAPPRDR
ncbi:MAG: glycosyltransferase family 2 protein [Thermoanaerobaculia bacterium]